MVNSHVLVVIRLKEEYLEGGLGVLGEVALISIGGFIDSSDFVETVLADLSGVVELLVDVNGEVLALLDGEGVVEIAVNIWTVN